MEPWSDGMGVPVSIHPWPPALAGVFLPEVPLLKPPPLPPCPSLLFTLPLHFGVTITGDVWAEKSWIEW